MQLFDSMFYELRGGSLGGLPHRLTNVNNTTHGGNTFNVSVDVQGFDGTSEAMETVIRDTLGTEMRRLVYESL